MSATTSTHAPDALRHGWAEDLFGLLAGPFVAAFGVHLLQSANAVTGGTAGLALLASYAIGWPFALLYLVITLPTVAVGWRMKGTQFALRTMAMIALVAGFSALHAWLLPIVPLHDGYAILAGNLLAGLGTLFVFRHNASMGGFSTIAFIVQERMKWKAGNVQLAMDCLVIIASLLVIPLPIVAWSVAGAAMLSLVLTLNHRPDRYLGY